MDLLIDGEQWLGQHDWEGEKRVEIGGREFRGSNLLENFKTEGSLRIKCSRILCCQLSMKIIFFPLGKKNLLK